MRKRFVFLLLAALLVFFVTGGVSVSREMKMPDRTIVQVPDDVPDLMALPLMQPRPVYIGKNFGLVAVMAMDADAGYSLLFAMEPGPIDSTKNIITLIAFAKIRDGKVLQFYADKQYFMIGFPSSKLVPVDGLPDLDKLIEMKSAQRPSIKKGGHLV